MLMTKKIFILLFLFPTATVNLIAQVDTTSSGNPLFKGWYADPEAGKRTDDRISRRAGCIVFFFCYCAR